MADVGAAVAAPCLLIRALWAVQSIGGQSCVFYIACSGHPKLACYLRCNTVVIFNSQSSWLLNVEWGGMPSLSFISEEGVKLGWGFCNIHIPDKLNNLNTNPKRTKEGTGAPRINTILHPSRRSASVFSQTPFLLWRKGFFLQVKHSEQCGPKSASVSTTRGG